MVYREETPDLPLGFYTTTHTYKPTGSGMKNIWSKQKNLIVILKSIFHTAETYRRGVANDEILLAFCLQ